MRLKTSTPKRKTKKTAKKKKQEISYYKKPDNLSVDQWQAALRKQFAESQAFKIENTGSHEVFSDFNVYNPVSNSSNKVSIRSNPKEILDGNNVNFCTCLDFKTNGLATCKHIEGVIHSFTKNARLKRIFTRTSYQPFYGSVYLKYEPSGRKAMLRIGEEHEEKIRTIAVSFFNENGELKDSGFDNFESFLAQIHAISPSFRCYSDAMEYILEVRAKNKRHAWVNDNLLALKNEKLNAYVKAELHPYQKEGVIHAIKAGRVLIADEMGLGKTLQAISAAEVLKKEFNIRHVLIICPSSLKYQWQTEIEKFTESTVNVIEGLHHKRIVQYEDDQFFYKIVSHHTAGNDVKSINQADYDLIILDEAQRIKNWKAKISNNLKRLESNYAIVLTGTPLENKIEELYSVIQFIDRFRLGALYRFLHSHQVTEPGTGKVIGYKDLNKIGELLSDILVRRTKAKVLSQLPARQDKILFVPMTKEQQKVHEECYDIVCKLVYRWRKIGFLKEKDRQRLLIHLNMMRMVCDSTYILDQISRHDTKVDEVMGILEEILSIEGEKVVIFSQWERMTRLIAQELDESGIKYESLHGGVPSKDRKNLLINFKNNPESKVFLSTDAGGVGLNLQNASYLINLDIPWNPAVLEQRIARIFRMGQKKKVNIINMVSAGTIEHRMLDVLKFKSSMAEGILDSGDDLIMMQEDRFRQFMNSVSDMVEQPDIIDKQIQESHAGDETDIYTSVPINEKDERKGEVVQLELFENKGEDHQESFKNNTKEDHATSNDGVEFLKQLAFIFTDSEKTKVLAKSMTETDEKSGKTYLKIPVENTALVENVLNGLGNLLKNIDLEQFR